MAADLGGLDALVFTGGIGENSVRVRSEVCTALDWIGVALDDAANRTGRMRIDRAGSPVRVLVVPTDEEGEIARAVRTLIASQR